MTRPSHNIDSIRERPLTMGGGDWKFGQNWPHVFSDTPYKEEVEFRDPPDLDWENWKLNIRRVTERKKIVCENPHHNPRMINGQPLQLHLCEMIVTGDDWSSTHWWSAYVDVWGSLL